MPLRDEIVELLVVLFIFLGLAGGMAFGLHCVRGKTGPTFERVNGYLPLVGRYTLRATDLAAKPFISGSALAERLKIPVVTLHGDVAAEIIRYARDNRITQIVVGHSDRTRWQEFIHGSIINRLTQELRTIDILIVAGPESTE